MRFDWQPMALAELARQVVDGVGPGRPALVGINGHSSSGKTSLATRLVGVLPRCGLLHTDDLAWNQGVFGWGRLLLEDVLPVVRSGAALRYKPPAWRERGREGAVELPGGLEFLVIEGVGASQESVRPELDLIIWVETDEPTRSERDAVRLAAGEMSAAGFAGWMAEENAYTTREQPWRHADLIGYGGESVAYDPEREVVVHAAG